jgi:hypothetical protein
MIKPVPSTLLMWAILDSGYWLCLLLAMPAAGCLFMI